MKKFISLFLVTAMVLTFAACGTGGVSQEEVQVGDIIQFGEFDWRVLDVQDNRALIITDMIIESRAYHNELEEITWADSDLRAYLNSEFFNSFSTTDRARIAQTTVVNNDNPWDFTELGGQRNTPGGANTQDHIFLLSLEEVVQYFGDSGQLANQNHPDNETWGFHDRYSDARIANHVGQRFDGGEISPNDPSWWWLRSPGSDGGRAADVHRDGDVGVNGHLVDNVFVIGYDVVDSRGGVRPALWLNL